MKDGVALAGLITVLACLATCAPVSTNDTADEALSIAERAQLDVQILEERVDELESQVEDLDLRLPY